MNLFDRIQRWLLLALITVTPLFFLPTTAEFFVTQKAYLILFVLLIVFVLAALKIFATGKLYSVKTAFGQILITLFAIRGVSILFASPNKIQALFSFPTGLMLLGSLTLLYFLTTYLAGSQREKLPLLQALNLGVFISGLSIIFFYFKPLAGVTLPQNFVFLQDRFSPLGNGIDSLVLLGFSLILLTASAATSIKKAQHSGLIKNLVSIGVVAIAAIIVAVLVFQPKDTQSALRLPPFNLSWYSALETLKSPKSAFIGVGVDNFDSLFTQVKTPAYNNTPLWNMNFALARSTVLHLWTESGLLSLLGILILGIYVIRELHGLRAHKDPVAHIYIAGGLYVGFVMLFMPPSFMVFFILFIYLTALTQQSMEHEHSPVREYDMHHHMAFYMGVAVVMVASAVSLGYYAGKAYAAEVYFKRSIDAIRANDGQAVYQNLKHAVDLQPRNERFRAQFAQVNLLLANNIARRAQPTEAQPTDSAGKKGEEKPEISQKDRQAIAQFIQQAIAEGKALVALNPDRSGNWNTLAVIYRNITNVAEGAQAWTIASYQEAIRRDANNPQLRLNLGGVYYGAQQYPQAIQHFQQAVLLKPSWANAHYNLAWGYYQNKQYVEAAAVMKNVVQLVDKKSEDYKAAQENLTLFKDKADEATSSGAVKPVAPDQKTQPQSPQPQSEPLTLPATPEAVLSPALKLPADSGPEQSPSPTPSQ